MIHTHKCPNKYNPSSSLNKQPINSLYSQIDTPRRAKVHAENQILDGIASNLSYTKESSESEQVPLARVFFPQYNFFLFQEFRVRFRATYNNIRIQVPPLYIERLIKFIKNR